MSVQAPAERFEGLPGFDYEYRFVETDEAEVAYVVDDGPDDGGGGTRKTVGDAGETFLCLHGEPTYSYLYRHVLPVLAERGRAVAMDLPGFGRSEQWPAVEDYTYERLYDALAGAVTGLDLTDVTLVCQDWGGLLGLKVAADHPDRFARLVPMNTGLMDGRADMPPVWHEFKTVVETAEDLDVGRIVQGGTLTELSAAELDAYRAPFPSEAHMAGVRAMPGLVPTEPDHPAAPHLRAAREALADWEQPAFVLFGDSDPITHAARDDLRELLPTASEQPDVWVEGASHFLQEDAGERIAREILDFVDRT